MQRGFKTKIKITLSHEQRRELESWQRSTTMRAGLVQRGRVILLLADGMPIAKVARTVGHSRPHVYRWAWRFLEQGIDGLADKGGRGRKPLFPPGSCGSCCQNGVRAA